MSDTTHDTTAATAISVTSAAGGGSVTLSLIDTASLIAFCGYSEEGKLLPFTCSTSYKQDDDLLIGLKRVRYGGKMRTRLMSLCRKGDMHGVQVLLRVHADVKAIDGSGNTALHCVCEKGGENAPPMIDLLVGAGADVNAKNKDGVTPLIEAAYSGHDAVCLRLIERGADVNAKNNDGTTPLLWAADNGHEAVCLRLIERGADVNARDNDGSTPLLWAACSGLDAVCLRLIEHGADVNARNNFGTSSLMRAACSGHEAVCLRLIEHGADVNARDNQGRSALTLAKSSHLKSILEQSIPRS